MCISFTLREKLGDLSEAYNALVAPDIGKSLAAGGQSLQLSMNLQEHRVI